MRRKKYPTNWKTEITGGPIGKAPGPGEYKQVRKHAKKLKKYLRKSDNKK